MFFECFPFLSLKFLDCAADLINLFFILPIDLLEIL
jgi:hypothetical protein